jgi:ribosomal protein S18 acetylase RimI-like enzyme
MLSWSLIKLVEPAPNLMQPEVRAIRESDAESFHVCLGTVAREGLYLALLDAPPLERTREFIASNVKNGVPQMVAVVGQEVVGWCDIQAPWHDTLKHSGSVGMGLLPAYRRRGLGTQLLTRCMDAAKAAGMTRIELEAREDNRHALALYRKLGFVQEGIKARGMRIHGQYVNTVMMALLL